MVLLLVVWKNWYPKVHFFNFKNSCHYIFNTSFFASETCIIIFSLSACEKLEVDQNAVVKIVLDMDGTEVDDEEYFDTLESNTVLMLLIDSQRWLMHGKPR